MKSSTKRPRVESRGGARSIPPTVDASADQIVGAVKLSSIELALVAAMSLEMARDCDELAEDSKQGLEARRTARRLGSGWRERARVLQHEACRLGAQATGSGEESREPSSSDADPERRQRARRTHQHRAGTSGGAS
jgi:hypothetical protein